MGRIAVFSPSDNCFIAQTSWALQRQVQKVRDFLNICHHISNALLPRGDHSSKAQTMARPMCAQYLRIYSENMSRQTLVLSCNWSCTITTLTPKIEISIPLLYKNSIIVLNDDWPLKPYEHSKKVTNSSLIVLLSYTNLKINAVCSWRE